MHLFSTLILVQVFLCEIVTSQHHHKDRNSDASFQRNNDHPKNGEHFDHESILGSKNVAEEYDHLSPDEAKRRLAILIPQMDKNKDGYIKQDELTDWIFRSFKMLSKEDAQERMEEVDVNSDGKATWEEYVAETYGMFDNKEGKLPDTKEYAEEKRMHQEDEELFKAADQDHDGILTFEEFLAFTHPEEYDHMIPILHDRTMRDKDLDKDGFISLDEFVGAAANGRHHNKEWYVVEKDRFENDYDKDQDGRLSSEEIRAWIAPDEREQAEQEAEHLILTADSSKDGVLSYDEIIDHHETFVGSDATDYGNHLHNTHKFADEL